MVQEAGRWYLAGIVSAGYSCAQGKQPGKIMGRFYGDSHIWQSSCQGNTFAYCIILYHTSFEILDWSVSTSISSSFSIYIHTFPILDYITHSFLIMIYAFLTPDIYHKVSFSRLHDPLFSNLLFVSITPGIYHKVSYTSDWISYAASN